MRTADARPRPPSPRRRPALAGDGTLADRARRSSAAGACRRAGRWRSAPSCARPAPGRGSWTSATGCSPAPPAAWPRGADVLADGARKLAGGDRALARRRPGARRRPRGGSSRSAGSLAHGRRRPRDRRGGGRHRDRSAGRRHGPRPSEAGSSLASGSDTLSRSASQANHGAQQLSSGLAKGAEQSPTYSKSREDALASTVSQPVLLSHTTQYQEHANGWLLGRDRRRRSCGWPRSPAPPGRRLGEPAVRAVAGVVAPDRDQPGRCPCSGWRCCRGWPCCSRSCSAG